jgi:predicted cupin superfamily sugar epimerase
MITADQVKTLLRLAPHPAEGGFFTETYRSEERVAGGALPVRYGGPRALGTAIYYLLTPDTFSAMHRLASDEIFHFYLGDPVEMLHLFPDGSGHVVTLGPDLLKGMRPQVVVPRGVWQGLRLVPGGCFALLGTTVAPGFDLADYEHAGRDHLLPQYPAFRHSILALTR